MKEKFQKVIEILKNNCINYNLYYTDEQIDEIVNNLLNSNDMNNLYDLVYVTKRFMKIVLGKYDSHTDVDFINENMEYINNQLPLKLKFENNKLYIVDSNDINIKNSEIKEINGISIQQLIEEIKSITRYSTEEWLYKQIEDILSSSTQMKILPSLRNANEINYSVENNNDISNINFELNKNYKEEFKRKEDNYSYEISGDTFIMHLNSCEKPKNYNNMAEYIMHINEVIKNNNINNFVLDLRGNTGGNQKDVAHIRVYFQNILFDKKMRENQIENIGKDLNLNITCLVDRNVFSSASLLVSELQELNIPCIGENIGTTYNNFGNTTRHNLEGIRLDTATRYFYRDEDKKYKYCDSKDELKNVYQDKPDNFKIENSKKEIKPLQLTSIEKEIYEKLKEKQHIKTEQKKKEQSSVLKKALQNNTSGYISIILASLILILIVMCIFILL